MKHIVILTGGYLNIRFAKEYMKTLSCDKVFAVDKGLEYAEALGIVPDYIIGDFDTVDKILLESYEKQIAQGKKCAYLDRYPAKKDATDTELAILKAIEEKAGKITLLAASGGRIDHMLANLNLLLLTGQAGIECYIVDETNRVRLLDSADNRPCIIQKKEQYGTYLSLIPITEFIEGLTITGVMYPLYKKKVYQGNSLTVSNRIVDKETRISLDKGKVLIIESMD
ncbi:MAG: thiamine diphosphokinase [Lachnospiraceae bacterium]|nr:thiamine diphosphokinase [Lachnospiraceae bacterium]